MKKALVNISLGITVVLFSYGIYALTGDNSWAKYIVLAMAAGLAWFLQNVINAIQTFHSKENNKLETKWAFIGGLCMAVICAFLPISWTYLIAAGIGTILTLYFWKHQV